MERYQVLLDREQRKRLERIARRQRRTLASVLRQALDIGLDVLERQTDIWERREQILAKWREEEAHMPRIERDLIHEAREERDADVTFSAASRQRASQATHGAIAHITA